MKQDITHQIGIVVKCHGPTDSKGARISLTLPRWENKRIYIPFDYAYRDSLDNATSALDAAGVKIAGCLDMSSHYVFCCDWSERPAIAKAFGLDEA
jgi:hypothetical protein